MPSKLTTQPHPFKVIGHAGMRTTSDGSLIIKPAFPTELEFYETLIQDPYLAPLKPFIPRFLGILSTDDEGYDDDTALLERIPIPPGRTQSLILENLCNAFIKPNTLDVKLGTIFHDDLTDPDKVLRMEKTSRETTSLQTGVRLTEFQVYDNVTSQPICTPKSYGKAIEAVELPQGIARFFPVHHESLKHNGSGTASPPTCGLPRNTLVPILRGIREAVSHIHKVYSSLEMRVIGGSLLIMYEADWSQAEEGVQRLAHFHVNGSSNDDGGADGSVHRRPPYLVKLVDFAHTRLTPGIGPDEGVLLGLDTMLRLLDGRITQLVDP